MTTAQGGDPFAPPADPFAPEVEVMQPENQLVPAGQPQLMTVDQAVSGVRGKILALVDTTLVDLKARAAKILAGAKDPKVPTTQAEADALADKIRECVTFRGDIERDRKGLTGRLDSLKSEIKAPFDGTVTPVCGPKADGKGGAEAALRDALLPWQLEQRRLQEAEAERVREAQRIADEEARKEAAEQQRIADEKAAEAARIAEAAKTPEDVAKYGQAIAAADEAQAQADLAQSTADTVASVGRIQAQRPVQRTAAGTTAGLAMTWTHVVEDITKLPPELVIPAQANDAAIKARYQNEGARAAIMGPDGKPTIPGVRIFQVPKSSIR